MKKRVQWGVPNTVCFPVVLFSMFSNFERECVNVDRDMYTLSVDELCVRGEQTRDRTKAIDGNVCQGIFLLVIVFALLIFWAADVDLVSHPILLLFLYVYKTGLIGSDASDTNQSSNGALSEEALRARRREIAKQKQAACLKAFAGRLWVTQWHSDIVIVQGLRWYAMLWVT